MQRLVGSKEFQDEIPYLYVIDCLQITKLEHEE